MPDKDMTKKQAVPKGQSQTTTPRASPPRSSPPPRASPPRSSPPRTVPAPAPANTTAPAPTPSQNTAPPTAPRLPSTRPPVPTSSQNTAPATASGLPLGSTRPLTLQPPRGPPSRGLAPAPPPANTYTPQDRDALQHDSAEATEEHLVLATDLVVGKLAAGGVPYALMGGFSLRMRGSARLTRDADLAVGGTMLALKTALSGDSRILLPRGPVSGVMRAYVRVGGSPNHALDVVPVCVDLITEGSLGAPRNIPSGSEEVEGMTDAGMRTYRVVDIQHILASKLAAFHARGNTDSNDFKDLVWILITSTYGAKVLEVSGNLSIEDRQVFLKAVLRSRPRPSAARVQRIVQLLRME